MNGCINDKDDKLTLKSFDTLQNFINIRQWVINVNVLKNTFIHLYYYFKEYSSTKRVTKNINFKTLLNLQILVLLIMYLIQCIHPVYLQIKIL